MKIRIISCCVFVIILCSCSQGNKVQETSINGDMYIVDLDKASKVEEISASAFFDSAEYIFLETTDDALIGRISDIQVFENKLFILDEDVTKSLFVYNTDGTFLYKISRIGQGPGEYTSLSDFTINTDKREIYLLDDDAEQILMYNIDKGEYITSIRLENGDRCCNIQYNKGRLYADANNKHTGTLLNEIDMKTGKKINKWLDADLYNQGWTGRFFVTGGCFHSKNADRNMYAQIFMDTIISIENGVVSPFLAVRSKDWMRKDELDKFTKNDYSELSYYLMDNKKMYGLSSVFDYRDLVSFQFFLEPNTFTAYLNKKDKTAVIAQLLKIDLLYENEDIYTGGFISSDSGGLYCEISPLYLKGMEMEPNPPVLKEHLRAKYAQKLSALQEDDNPILIYLSNSKFNSNKSEQQ